MPQSPPSDAPGGKFWQPLLVFGLALAFYLVTLAPTVLWGDDAYFQRTAFEGTLRADGGGHWFWLQAARLFTHLPWGDVAYRVNLLSAVAAAGTVAMLFGAARTIGLSAAGAVVTAVALAVSHTFWMHAVRAEVYSVFTLLLALQLWLWFLWRPDRPWPIVTAVALFGVTLLGHQMAVLLLPALALLVWQRRAWLTRRLIAMLALAGMLGLAAFLAVMQVQIRLPAGVNWLAALRLYFTSADADFSGAILDYTLASLPRDVALWLAFLGLQFVGLAGLLGVWGLVDIWRQRRTDPRPGPWLVLLVFYATTVLFAISYRVNDQFVFFLPGYLAFALFVGRGWDALLRVAWFGSRIWLQMAAVVLLIAVPIGLYFGAASGLSAVGANPLGVRELPGRDPNFFFLYPAKRGDIGASVYGRGALDDLPPGSLLIADHTPLEPLRYLQVVEGVRPDVTLVKIEPGDDLALLVAALPEDTAVFLADDDPRYYNLAHLSGARLEPHGVVFALRLAE